MISKVHYFFYTCNSPWPLLATLNSFNLLFSLLTFLKTGIHHSFFVSILVVAGTSMIWWFFYRGENVFQGLFSLRLMRGLKIGMLIFISSEVFFFFSFFWSYFHFSLSPTIEVGLIWPPYYIEIFDCLDVPLVNTLILLSSGMTVTVAHESLWQTQIKKAKIYLGVTIILGLIFTICQLAEYNRSFFSIGDSTFGTTFFILTGFHGIHVLVGTIFLFIVLIRFFKFTSNKNEILRFELASWYWHFVDVVWIFLYYLIYYCNNWQ